MRCWILTLQREKNVGGVQTYDKLIMHFQVLFPPHIPKIIIPSKLEKGASLLIVIINAVQFIINGNRHVNVLILRYEER